jgi:hypothetical protein
MGIHLAQSFADSCYDEKYTDSDWSGDAGSLLSECLNFDHENSFAYWIGKAPRTSVSARAKQSGGSKLTEDWDSMLAEGAYGEELGQ